MTLPIGAEWAIGFVAGAGVAALAFTAMRDTFAQPLFARRNHRGVDVPVGAGVLLAIATVAVSGTWMLLASIGDATARGATRTAVLVLACIVSCGFGLLGLFDDLAAQGDDRGFSGHVKALLQGRLTTGGVKLIVGGMLALALTAVTGFELGFWRIVLGGAVISLAANLGNLFDRAPGRCTKVALLCGVVLFATAGAVDRPALIGVAVVLGAAAGLGLFDLREQLMLGDAGSNVLGAVLGWGVVATTGWVAQVVVLAILLALNAASEKVSFSAVIAATPPLRAFDRLGRRPPPG
jgi:UDP-N-acetylmuramyl pentapeptide phosphotransferase/UDP-N-acetylglucosamine-1-phosphate transferase